MKDERRKTKEKRQKMNNQFSYRKLQVYQKAIVWVSAVYRLVKLLPKEEMFALSSQIRRACISVPSNIAEGMSRSSHKEIVHFLEISYGSLMEVQCQLEIAQLLNYIKQSDVEQIESQTKEIARMLSGLRLSKIKSGK
jgi:four helix bundle protein